MWECSFYLLNPRYSITNRLVIFYRGFTTLVADSQFSILGVVLVALLARAGRIVGLPEPKSGGLARDADVQMLPASSIREPGDDAGEIVLREYVKEIGRVVGRRNDKDLSKFLDQRKRGNTGNKTVAEDEADFFGNRNCTGEEEKMVVAKEMLAQQGIVTTKSASRPKKRRKKGNAIDELFGDLI
jgi:ribonuclease MRP protein subunit RMP1